jgi:tRNA threonylcarbamoyladenosine biosynthesis protein TsaE
MTESTLIIKNETELAALAARLAPLLKTGDLVTLQGDLGAGKTAFTRALINSLSPLPEEVPSPTFSSSGRNGWADCCRRID